jgi:hypothetical protein
MELRIHIELQEDLLLVTVGGTLAFDAALRLLKQMVDTAAEKQVIGILLNGLAMDGTLSILDRYRVAVEIMAYLREFRMHPKLAIVGKPPTLNDFGVMVARNRGLAAKFFSSQQEAMNWLKFRGT